MLDPHRGVGSGNLRGRDVGRRSRVRWQLSAVRRRAAASSRQRRHRPQDLEHQPGLAGRRSERLFRRKFPETVFVEPAFSHIANCKAWAVVVAHLAEWSFPTPEICSSNPNMDKNLSVNFIL